MSDTRLSDALQRLADVIESRKGGDPQASYVSRLLAQGPDAFLKKIGEEATEVVMAAKDAQHGGQRQKIVDEMADLWFHSLLALAYYDLGPHNVLAELTRRAGTSGLEEKALRRAIERQAEQHHHKEHPMNPNPDIIDIGGKTEQQLASLRQITLAVYILYALACITGVSAIVAVVINYIKREDAQGTLYESHFTWQIRTFWWGLLWTWLGVLTVWLLGLGFVVLLVAGIWLIYRVVKGALNWNDHKPMPI